MPLSQTDLARQLAELKEKRPDIFTHPELRPDEVYLGHYLIDIVDFEIARYKERGIRSARVGKEQVLKPVQVKVGVEQREEIWKVEYCPIFVNVYEVLKAMESQKKEEAEKEES